ncbi:acyl carrier protein [Paenibacillus sp. BAC0078]
MRVSRFTGTHGYVGQGNWQQWEAANILEGYDYVESWRMLVEGEIQVVDVPSDHFSILEEPSIHIVKEHVQQIIALREENEKDSTRELVADSKGLYSSASVPTDNEFTLNEPVRDGGSDLDLIILALREIVSEKIKLPADEIMPDEDLSAYGVDSILSTFIMERVQNQYGEEISLNAIIEHKSLRELAIHIHETAV